MSKKDFVGCAMRSKPRERLAEGFVERPRKRGRDAAYKFGETLEKWQEASNSGAAATKRRSASRIINKKSFLDL